DGVDARGGILDDPIVVLIAVAVLGRCRPVGAGDGEGGAAGGQGPRGAAQLPGTGAHGVGSGGGTGFAAVPRGGGDEAGVVAAAAPRGVQRVLVSHPEVGQGRPLGLGDGHAGVLADLPGEQGGVAAGVGQGAVGQLQGHHLVAVLP